MKKIGHRSGSFSPHGARNSSMSRVNRGKFIRKSSRRTGGSGWRMETTEVIPTRRGSVCFMVIYNTETMVAGGRVYTWLARVFVMRLLYYYHSKTTIIDQNRRRRRLARRTRAHPSHCIIRARRIHIYITILLPVARVVVGFLNNIASGCPRLFYSGRKRPRDRRWVPPRVLPRPLSRALPRPLAVDRSRRWRWHGNINNKYSTRYIQKWRPFLYYFRYYHYCYDCSDVSAAGARRTPRIIVLYARDIPAEPAGLKAEQ